MLTTLLLALFACSDTTLGKRNTPPQANLSTPSDGASFLAGEAVALEGTATDPEDDSDGTALGIAWYADNTEICSGTTASADGAVTCEWTATEGTTALRLVVTDSDDETDEAQAGIVVTPNEDPSIAIVSPTEEGEYYFDVAVTFEATVSDVESGAEVLVVSWESDVDGPLGEVSPASSGTASTGATLSEGAHILTATVTDPGGNSDLATVNVVVHGANTSPDCAIEAPADGSAYALGDTVIFTGTVFDAETGPTALALTLTSTEEAISEGETVPVDDEGAFTYAWAPTVAGTHVVTLTGTDGLGETCTDTLTLDVCDTNWYYDGDGDGAGDPDLVVVACDQPEGYAATGDDCVDSDPDIGPGAAEEDSYTDCMQDADGDGWGDADVPAEVTAGSDCDDDDAAISPAGDEVCDGADNDCDGTSDGSGAADATTWYADTDGDGYGDSAATTLDCDQPAGYVSDRTDCDDGDGEDHPGATEDCDGDDDDCDGEVDEEGTTTFYADDDGDGYGDPGDTSAGCSAPSGYVADATDCDDGDGDVSPGATEVCDGEDQDCDGTVDDGASLTWYADADGDGYGDAGDYVEQCTAPTGYVASDDDCHDGDADTFPGAASEESPTACMQDADGDGFGDDSPPSGASAGTDCDDGAASINPDGTESCDGEDDDCDGTTDEGTTIVVYADLDADGYGDPAAPAAACAAGTGQSRNDDDCDDTNGAVSPDATEVCDTVDNDCDGDVDDDDPGVDTTGGTTFYADVDLDGYGDTATTTTACDAPAGFVADAADCDDADADVNPGAAEVCEDAIDNDCDGGAGACNTGTYDLATEAYAVFRGATDDYVGYGLAFADDADGDGDQGLWIGGYGSDLFGYDRGYALYVEDLSGSRSLPSVYTDYFVRAHDSSSTGHDIASGGDFDGDGVGDVIVGVYSDTYVAGAGSASVLSGATGSALGFYYGESDNDWTGMGVAFVPDLDGDGLDEVMVASPGTTGTNGRVSLILGGTTTSGSALSSSTYYAYFAGEASADYLGGNQATRNLAAGDLDGDGTAELVMTSGLTSASAGAVYVYYGPPASGSQSVAGADLIVSGSAGSTLGFGPRVVPDLDGDGYDELAVGAPSGDRSYVLFGGAVATGTMSATAADIVITGPTNSSFGYEQAGADLDLDGDGDLLVSAPSDDTAASDAGAVYSWAGPLVAGTLSYTSADLVLLGDDARDSVGLTLELGDYDGDGDPDVATGAHEYSSGYDGAIYLWASEAW